MGVLAENVLKNGGEVIGVEPQFFIDQGLEYKEITKLYITEDMPSRRSKMIELGDAFIAWWHRNFRRDCGSNVQGFS